MRQTLQSIWTTLRGSLQTLPPEPSCQVITLQYTAHAFVRTSEERSRNRAGIATCLNEGVAVDLDGVLKIAVAPRDSGSNSSRRSISGL